MTPPHTAKKVLVNEVLVHPQTGAHLLPNEVQIRHDVESGEVIFIARCGHARCDNPFLVVTRPPGMPAQQIFEMIEKMLAAHNSQPATVTPFALLQPQLH